MILAGAMDEAEGEAGVAGGIGGHGWGCAGRADREKDAEKSSCLGRAKPIKRKGNSSASARAARPTDGKREEAGQDTWRSGEPNPKERSERRNREAVRAGLRNDRGPRGSWASADRSVPCEKDYSDR